MYAYLRTHTESWLSISWGIPLHAYISIYAYYIFLDSGLCLLWIIVLLDVDSCLACCDSCSYVDPFSCLCCLSYRLTIMLQYICKPSASGFVAAKRCWVNHSAQSGVGCLLAGIWALPVGTAALRCRSCHRRSGTACTAALQSAPLCTCYPQPRRDP